MKAAALKYTVLTLAATLAIIIIALVPFHAFLTVSFSSVLGYYTELRLWKEVLLLGIGLAVVYLLLTDHKIRSHTLSRRLIWLIIVYGLIHLIVGVISYQNDDVTLKSLFYGFLVNLRFLFFFMVVWALALRTSRLKANWQKMVVWPAVVVVVFGILQLTVLPTNFLTNFGYGPATIEAVETVNSNDDFVRVFSTLRGPNPLGAYLIIPITVVLAMLLKANRKWRLGILLAGLLIVLAASFSRSGAVGAFVSMVLVVVLAYREKLSRRVLLAAGGGLITVLTLAAIIVPSSTYLQNVLFHTDEQSTMTASSNSQRLEAWSMGIEDIAEEPFGEGPGSAGPASTYNNNQVEIAESYYLQIGQEVGVLGLAVFLLITAGVGYLLWLRRADPLALVLFASLVGISLVNLLSHAWTDDTLAYIWWGLAGIAMVSLPLVAEKTAVEAPEETVRKSTIKPNKRNKGKNMKSQAGFAPIILVGLIAVVSIAGIGALVYNKANEKSQSVVTDAKSNQPAGTAADDATTIEKKAFELPENWRTFESEEGFPTFAYPAEYGEMLSPAKGEAGKYTDGGFVSSILENAPLEGLSGRFTYTRYTDTAPVIGSTKYGPRIQLTGSTWKVAEETSADPNSYKVGDTYKQISSLDSSAGKKVYILTNADEGIRIDTLIFIDGSRMFTLGLPTMNLGSYGPYGTVENEKKRTVSYENLVSRVLDSVGN